MKLSFQTKKSSPLLIVLSLFLGAALHAQSGAEAKSTGPDQGTLLIIGGAASDIFYEKFMELVGGADAPIVVIPTAITSDPLSKEDLESFKKSFLNRGFKNVTVLHTRDRQEANDKEFVEPILKARGVWFSGGRQWRHADSYLNTLTHDAFFELLDRGESSPAVRLEPPFRVLTWPGAIPVRTPS
jgi:cyanophycinase